LLRNNQNHNHYSSKCYDLFCQHVPPDECASFARHIITRGETLWALLFSRQKIEKKALFRFSLLCRICQIFLFRFFGASCWQKNALTQSTCLYTNEIGELPDSKKKIDWPKIHHHQHCWRLYLDSMALHVVGRPCKFAKRCKTIYCMAALTTLKWYLLKKQKIIVKSLSPS